MKPRPPRVWIDGRLIGLGRASVSVEDRSYRYGDGVFETLRCYGGVPFRWADHIRRMRAGGARLQLSLPLSNQSLSRELRRLVKAHHLPDAVIRLHLSRGSGPRGLSIRGAQRPRVVMTLEPAPIPARDFGVRLATTRWTLPSGIALSQCKSAARLPYLLARIEAERAGADLGLLVTARGDVIEADSANVFWIEGDRVFTPPLDRGALDGITRRTVIELAAELGSPVRERLLGVARRRRVRTLFLTSSVQEIVRVRELDGRVLDAHPLVEKLHEAYRARVARERLR
jgi:branched-chain amino acid aminotransferase